MGFYITGAVITGVLWLILASAENEKGNFLEGGCSFLIFVAFWPITIIPLIMKIVNK